jgi:hypothetical protein
MEYRFFQKLQKIPRWIRVFFGIFIFLLGLIAMLIPGIPGAIPGIVMALLFVVSAHNIRFVRKIRRGLVHLMYNFSWKNVHLKWYDIKGHLKKIISREK